MRLLILNLFFLAMHVSGRAQGTDSFIPSRINNYVSKNARSSLFVHFDKNVYTSNETVWFSAYIIKDEAPDAVHQILSLFLVRCRDSTIIQEEKYFIQGRLCPGSLLL